MSGFKSYLLKGYLVLNILLLVCSLAFSQPGDPPPPDPPIPDDNPVPITGIEYLIISGGILGGYKLFKSKKEHNPAT
jgi:hypothetical protein